MTQRIGILGGTFDPIHLGHLAAAEEVRERMRLDQVLFVPSFLPPHKEERIPTAAQRLEMVRIAVAGNPAFRASDMEIRRGGRSYTIDTIEELRRIRPGDELYFITGLDSFLDIVSWKDWRHLLGACAFIVLSRKGFRFADITMLGVAVAGGADLAAMDEGTRQRLAVESGGVRLYLESIPFYEISSSDIRERIRQGRSVKYLLPEAVERYIIESTLYA